MSEQQTSAVPEELLAAAGGHPLAAVFCRVLEVIEGGKRQAGAALGELQETASLHGYDELADAAGELRSSFDTLDPDQRRQQVGALLGLVADDLEMVPVVAGDSEPLRSFSDVLRSVPGVGAGKVKLLRKAGITDCTTLRAAGIKGLTALRGINAAQAEMLLNECAERARVDPFPVSDQRPVLRGLETRVLGELFDGELVGIYLDSTIDRTQRLRELLVRGNLEQAGQAVGALIIAANDMGYSELLDAYSGVKKTLLADTPEPDQLESAAGMLQRLAGELQQVRRRLELQQRGKAAARAGAAAAPTTGTASPAGLKQAINELADTRSALQELGNDMQTVISKVITAGEVSPLNASALRSFLSRLEQKLDHLGRIGSRLQSCAGATATQEPTPADQP